LTASGSRSRQNDASSALPSVPPVASFARNDATLNVLPALFAMLRLLVRCARMSSMPWPWNCAAFSAAAASSAIEFAPSRSSRAMRFALSSGLPPALILPRIASFRPDFWLAVLISVSSYVPCKQETAKSGS
jgi:hypothetical protein